MVLKSVEAHERLSFRNNSSVSTPRALRWHGRALRGLIVLCAVAGCAELDLAEKIPWKDSDGDKSPPTKMTVLWTHTVLNQPGRRGVRGFGGRIMFHGKDTDKPMQVEGGLAVYAFDETERKTTVPERKFMFTAEQFAKHYSESKIGHSYSVWIPWDEVGGPPRRINLVTRFEPIGGSLIMSESSLQILPGIPEEEYDEDPDELTEATEGAVEQAGYLSGAARTRRKPRSGKQQMKSDTIDVPPNFANRRGPVEDVDAAPTAKPARTKDQATPTGSSRTSATRQDQETVPTKPAAAEAAAAIGNERPNGITRTMQRAEASQAMLQARKKQLSDHFARTKSQALTGSTAQSGSDLDPSALLPADEPSVPRRSPSLLPKKVLDSAAPDDDAPTR